MRKNVFLMILLTMTFAFSHEVNATELERNADNNYGVNKKWEITSNNKDNILNTPYVDASEKIYDYGDILTDTEEAKLYILIKNFIDTYNTELIIYTVNEPYYYDSKNEDLAADFYDYNDFGIDYELYDGIVLYRNAYASDPYYDIYTFGNAQLYFGQDRYDVMLDGIYSYISSGSYYMGFSKWIDYINDDYASGIDYVYRHYYVNDMGYLVQKFVPNYFIALSVSGVITFMIIMFLVKKNSMVKKAFRADDYLKVNTINITRKEDNYLRSHTSSYTVSSSSGGGGGGHSHSGSSGGGHSSGGGRHG